MKFLFAMLRHIVIARSNFHYLYVHTEDDRKCGDGQYELTAYARKCGDGQYGRIAHARKCGDGQYGRIAHARSCGYTIYDRTEGENICINPVLIQIRNSIR